MEKGLMEFESLLNEKYGGYGATADQQDNATKKAVEKRLCYPDC